MSTPARDWDAAGNGPEDPRQPGVQGPDIGIGFSGHSGYSGYAYVDYATTATITTTDDLVSTTVHINPQPTWAYAQPQYIQPIEFTFQTSSWKYVLCYVLSTMLSPWLAIWSKVTGRKCGFRYKNPNFGYGMVRPTSV